MRLFVAITPPDFIRIELASLQTRIPGVRWIPHRQIHLTLKFAGHLSDEKRNLLKEGLRKIPFHPFELQIEGVGRFPQKGSPRILWAGVRETPSSHPVLATLRKEVVRIAEEAGAEPESKPWIPHLTLARINTRQADDPGRLRSEVVSFLERHQSLRTSPFTVERITLYESRISPTGVEYFAMEHYPARREL